MLKKNSTPSGIHVGVISDTHGQLRPEALKALQDSHLIIHAGDIGKPEVLGELETIAPVYAVRGNVDTASWATAQPFTRTVEVGDFMFYALHNIDELNLDPRASGFRMVISGHTHRPLITECDDVIYLNPGSAGSYYYSQPVTVAHVRVTGKHIEHRIVVLNTD